MEARRSLEETEVYQRPELTVVQALGELAVADYMIDNPDLKGISAHSERAILYLLAQPNFSLTEKKSSRIICNNLELTTSQWEKTRRRLRSEHNILAERDVGEDASPYVVHLDAEAVLAKEGQLDFITPRVLRSLQENISNAPESADISEVTISAAIERSNKRQSRLQKENLARKRIERKKEEDAKSKELTEKVFSQTKFPKPEALKADQGLILMFVAHTPEGSLTTRYDPADFAKLYPVHKLLLAIGHSHGFNQAPDENKAYIKRILNKGVKEGYILSSREVEGVAKEAIKFGLATKTAGAYKLEPKAFGFLKVLRNSKASATFA